MSDQGLLDVYLSDHLAGATAGLELARRLAAAPGASYELVQIADEIESDRKTLRGVMSAVGVSPPLLKVALGWVGEKAGRLKLNDRLFGRSPLSMVIELESLIVGVSGKLQLWRALAAIAAGDPRLQSFDFDRLQTQAEDQRRRLEHFHSESVRDALGSAEV
jgi:hypothetical protein